jgi:hypothetical protein
MVALRWHGTGRRRREQGLVAPPEMPVRPSKSPGTFAGESARLGLYTTEAFTPPAAHSVSSGERRWEFR